MRAKKLLRPLCNPKRNEKRQKFNTEAWKSSGPFTFSLTRGFFTLVKTDVVKIHTKLKGCAVVKSWINYNYFELLIITLKLVI